MVCGRHIDLVGEAVLSVMTVQVGLLWQCIIKSAAAFCTKVKEQPLSRHSIGLCQSLLRRNASSRRSNAWQGLLLQVTRHPATFDAVLPLLVHRRKLLPATTCGMQLITVPVLFHILITCCCCPCCCYPWSCTPAAASASGG